MRTDHIDELVEIVPQTFGEAVQLYPWLENECEAHEWDNRTTIQNAVWLILHLKTKGGSESERTNSNDSRGSS